jgi:hypothetical protein
MISVVQIRCSWSKPGTPVIRDVLLSGPSAAPGLSPLYPTGRGEGAVKSDGTKTPRRTGSAR